MAQWVKNLPEIQETQVLSLGWEMPWRRKWHPTPVLLLGESHGRRSLVDCSPRGGKESGTTEQLYFPFHALYVQHALVQKAVSLSSTLPALSM